MRVHRTPAVFVAVFCVVLTLLVPACAQTGASSSAAPGSVAPNSEADVMNHLNDVLRWYRQWSSLDVTLSRPGDEIYIQSGRSLADQIVRLEFQSALAQAALIGSSNANSSSTNAASPNGTSVHNILQFKERLDQQMKGLQTQLDAVNAKLPVARPKDRNNLLTERDTIQGQLQLAQALQESLQKLASFMTTSENANGAIGEMTGKIVALERTIPSLAVPAAASKPAAKSASAAEPHPAKYTFIGSGQNVGLIGQMGEMIRLIGSLRTLNQLSDDAAALQISTRQLRAPLIAAIKATLRQGQLELGTPAPNNQNSGAAAGQNVPSQPSTAFASPSQSTETPAEKQRAMTQLVRRFKQISSATLPLSQQLILLDQSQGNLDQLRNSIDRDYDTILRSLLLRVILILVALGIIWLFSWLWRRATFRYVHDVRRRRQFLVLRRAITGFCMFVVVVLGFVSDFSSLATYAGLITAGVAVALQAVILSIAAYFFLVGRYGVRVGDRVTVVYNGANAVAGDVVDIGLVRFYMMELAGTGIDMQPTGRICVFPNSVLFQTNPLFKQMPGTEYTWREVSLPLHPEADVQLAQQELLAAVNKVYAGYREILERRQLSAEETLAIHAEIPKPTARVRFTAAGLEAVVRYPIPLRQAAELDDRIVKEVVEVLRGNPAIRLIAGSSPSLRA